MPPPPRRFALDMDEDMDDDDDAAAWPGSDSDAQRGSSVFDSDTRSRYDVRGASTLSPGPGLGQGLGPTPTEIIDALGQEPPQRGGQGYGDTRIAEPGAALTRLRAAWQAERGAPELRIWEAEAVGAVEAMVEEQGSILSTLAADDDTTEEEHLRLSLVAVDMERARWLLKAYLQTRLGKLEQYATYISGNSAEVLKLSAAERKYLNDFAALRTSTLKSTVLDHLPTEWTGLKDQLDYDAWTSDMGTLLCISFARLRTVLTRFGVRAMPVDKPPLDSPVFVRCLRDSETLQLPEYVTLRVLADPTARAQ